jgi:hypothetical protein
MFTVERRVGRLIEFDVPELRLPGDVDRMMAIIREKVGEIAPRESAIMAADYRAITVFGPDVADRVREMYSRFNPRVLRSAILLGVEQATVKLQVARLVREAAHPARRTFEHADAMEQWLAEVLTLEELARLRAFLSRT